MKYEVEGWVHERLRVPMLVTDAAARVLWANAEAEAFIRARAALAIAQGRLEVRGRCTPGLEPVLRDTASRAGASATLVRVRTGEGASLHIVASKLRAREARPQVLLQLDDPDHLPAGSSSQLRSLYRLTPAEARVALAVVRGASPAEAAEQLGIQLPTVRSQLKSVFLKTGTTRQADLVRHVTRLLAVAPRP